MIPTSYDAWKDNETIRQWFEVVLDTAANPPQNTAYVCKCCWEQFSARTNLFTLLGHANWHDSRGESAYSSTRPSAITGEQVLSLYQEICEQFDAVTPEVGTWKFQCRGCKKLLPHRTAQKDLMDHARECGGTASLGGKMQLTNPAYISQQMFDRTLGEKFQRNPDDDAVRDQARTLIQLVHGSKWRAQIIVDIMHAAQVSGHISKEQTAEIAFCMGLQFGFELALSHPPVSTSH